MSEVCHCNRWHLFPHCARGPGMQVRPEAGVGQTAFALQCFASSVGDRSLRSEELASYKILVGLLAGFVAKV